MSAQPNILFASPVFPDVTGYGLAMRAGALLEALAAHGRVYLLIIPLHDPWRTALPVGMRSLCADCRIVPLSRLDRVMARIRGIAQDSFRRGGPPPEWRFVSTRLTRAAGQAFDGIRFDFVYVFRLYMTPFAASYLRQNALKGRYLDLDDIESVTRARLAALYHANGLPRQARRERWAARQYGVYERELLPGFDAVAVGSSQDRALIDHLVPGGRVSVLPNVARIPVIAPEIKSPLTPLLQRGERFSSLPANGGWVEHFTLLFVGNMNYYPNRDAVAFFIDQVLPLLRGQTRRSIRFVVAGSGAWRSPLQRRHMSQCSWRGFVADLAPCYRQADAVVIPLRAGGGTRIKVLEAFAFQRPVVSTRIGVEGIGARHERHLLIADEPAHFAAQCHRLMDDPRLVAALTRHAFELVNDSHSPGVLRRQLGNMLGFYPTGN